jgi:hypothetical protein
MKETIMKTVIYYSIQDAGDGSAYTIFLETKELAKWDQEQMTDSWAEDCWGELILESEGPVTCEESLSVIGYYIERLDDWDEKYGGFNKKEFEEKFFPDGVPKIRVKLPEDDNEKYRIYVNGVCYYKTYVWVDGVKEPITTEVGRVKLEEEFNCKAQACLS